MKTARITGFLVASLAAFALPAQRSAVLESYVRSGLEQNLALRQRGVEVDRSREALRQARAMASPTLQFQATYTRSAGGRSIEFPVGDLLNPVYGTLNFLTQSTAFPTLENQSIQFLPDNFHETKFRFAYPLFNASLRHNRRARESLLAGAAAQRDAAEHALRFDIEAAYLTYLQALEAEKIYLHARTVLTELRRFNESLVKNDVATRDVVTTAEYELSRTDNELARLRAGQSSARAYFNFLLHRPLDAGVEADTALLRADVPDYHLPALIVRAVENRRELDALEAGLAAAASGIALRRDALRLPSAYVGGEFGFQGFGYSFDREQAFALGQVGLTYDLFTGGRRNSELQEARLESERLRLQAAEAREQIALQVTRAWHDFQAARQSWQTARTGLQAAEASFRIVQNKYRAQQALLLEFLDAQNRVTTARLQVLLAWTDVLLREAALNQHAPPTEVGGK
jgi:outer membrane protein TolC